MPRESNLATPVWLPRFLDPRHAIGAGERPIWQGDGKASTPGAAACCRIRIALDADNNAARIRHAAFSVYGPPVTIACADWACEWLDGRTIESARGLCVQAFEQALALAPHERYAAVLVIDALAAALTDSRPTGFQAP